jgi:predicted metal-dependent HD superfamily phosphohydrolase
MFCSAIASNNEKKRGKLAVFLLTRLGLPAQDIACCKWFMLSTKNSEVLILEDQGNTCLLDIDLAILEEKWEIYLNH